MILHNLLKRQFSSAYRHTAIKQVFGKSSLDATTTEYIFGMDCVRNALATNRRKIYQLLVYQNETTATKKTISALDTIIDKAKLRNIPIQYASKTQLDELSQDRPHQNVVIQATPFHPMVINELPENTNHRLWLLLVDVVDPQNVGAIIRTAAFYNIAGIITTLGGSADFTPMVSKASAGAMETFPGLFRVKSPMKFIQNAKAEGVKVIATGLNPKDPKSTMTHLNTTLPDDQPVLLVLGNEGTGLSETVRNECTEIIQIPGAGRDYVDCLNVSVAAGILIDHFTKRLHK